MNIIIVGGGVSGLSTYLLLQKHLPASLSSRITIYERHHPHATTDTSEATASSFGELSSSTAIVGGGLGISANGMRALRTLDQQLYDAVVAQGYVCENFCFRAARGWRLGLSPTGDKRNPQEWCVASSRHGLWECLRDAAGKDVIQYRAVLEVKIGEAGKPVVRFVDGEEEEADLVIGADGVRSVVKKGVFGEVDQAQYPIVYENQIGVGGFVDYTPPAALLEEKSMVFTFGANGFFGYSPTSPTSLMWWSTCEAAQVPEETRISVEDMRAQLKQRHSKWKDPIIQEIINKCDVESIYPVWTTPPLPHWGQDGLLLVGDAAHALNPTSGQGSSQALEDATTLVLLLKLYLGQSGETGGEGELSVREAINLASKTYYEVRGPRVRNIADRTKQLSARKGDQGLIEEMIGYFFFWMIIKFPSIGKKIFGDVNQELYHWDAAEEIDKVLKQRDEAR
ncbi:extracellular salicylate hydroxylase/monooxygenase [Trichodelitschia bisporula]|uniref:Extracellular salicylate hydroxylase/monooxygenase n=1 Tax=Trichodelitschia bisporula TaxID=703511 RepID=A0A6G1I8U1_9PEZI|nr:extracellular salicylate hydroxylase/monooxygenase [Trichodelitschia bisporula]